MPTSIAHVNTFNHQLVGNIRYSEASVFGKCAKAGVKNLCQNLGACLLFGGSCREVRLNVLASRTNTVAINDNFCLGVDASCEIKRLDSQQKRFLVGRHVLVERWDGWEESRTSKIPAFNGKKIVKHAHYTTSTMFTASSLDFVQEGSVCNNFALPRPTDERRSGAVRPCHA